MKQYIDKSALVEKIVNKLQDLIAIKENAHSAEKRVVLWAKIDMCNEILSFLDTLETKEINTWHLQKNEDIYDAVKDWSLHSFLCLMDDGSIQKFTGTLCECADGSINTHIDAFDDNYDDVDKIIFWIETPYL